MSRVDTHTLEISQRGERLHLDADRARPVEECSDRWRGELRLWDSETLMGWYRSTDAAVRSKGPIYLAREEAQAHDTVRALIDTEGTSRGRAG